MTHRAGRQATDNRHASRRVRDPLGKSYACSGISRVALAHSAQPEWIPRLARSCSSEVPSQFSPILTLAEPSKNKTCVHELRVMVRHHRVEQRLVLVGFPGWDHGANRERAQCVGDRQCPFCRILAPGKRKDIRTSLALTVDIDTTHLVDQRIFSNGRVEPFFSVLWPAPL